MEYQIWHHTLKQHPFSSNLTAVFYSPWILIINSKPLAVAHRPRQFDEKEWEKIFLPTLRCSDLIDSHRPIQWRLLVFYEPFRMTLSQFDNFVDSYKLALKSWICSTYCAYFYYWAERQVKFNLSRDKIDLSCSNTAQLNKLTENLVSRTRLMLIYPFVVPDCDKRIDMCDNPIQR